MNPILVYGFPLGSSMGLVAALEWLGKPYELCRVDMLKEMKNDDYARINGRLETPALVTSSARVLTETMAIALWMENLDVDRTISFEPGTAEADRMHQMMAFLNTGFTAAFIPLWATMEMNSPDANALKVLREFGIQCVIERHDRLEAMIGDTPYLVGKKPTLADAIFIGVARWLDFHGVAESSRWPRMHELRKRLEADSAVRFATAIENGEQSAGSGTFIGHVALQDVVRRYGH